MKQEQGAVHKDYLFEQFELYSDWTTYKSPYVYIPSTTRGTYTAGVIKSYSFRTITHPAFNRVYDLFMIDGKKRYKEGTIKKHLSSVGLSFWVRDDGSLQKNNEVILSTMGFTKEENIQMVYEQNMKFKLHRKVVIAKKHFAIYIPASDAPVLREHLVYLPNSMKYKMPVLKKSRLQPITHKKTSIAKYLFLFLKGFYLLCINFFIFYKEDDIV